MLAGAQPSTRSTVEVRVVLAVRREGRVDGVTGRLKVRELPGGPAGLFPDPEALIVQPANEAFDRALRLAWKFSGGDKQRSCVLWRIRRPAGDDSPPVPARLRPAERLPGRAAQ
jgi:hypothetical protein